jgi:hypothetical protein
MILARFSDRLGQAAAREVTEAVGPARRPHRLGLPDNSLTLGRRSGGKGERSESSSTGAARNSLVIETIPVGIRRCRNYCVLISREPAAAAALNGGRQFAMQPCLAARIRPVGTGLILGKGSGSPRAIQPEGVLRCLFPSSCGPLW